MAYIRKSAPKRKAPMKRRAPAKKSVAKTVTALVRTVKKLNKVSYDKVDWRTNLISSTSVTSPYVSYNVSKTLYAGGPLWGYQTSETNANNKLYLNRKTVYVSVRQNNEPNLIRYTMFLVSLKDQGADATTFDPASGELTLAAGTHYASLGTDQTRVSPLFFNIHAVKRFTMGYEGSAGPTADTYSEKRFNFTVVPKQKMIANPKGDVLGNASFTFPKDPSQNYFVILFNDNSTADLESNKLDIMVVDNIALPN